MRIAVLLTCFNRRDATLGCLRRLSAQILPSAHPLSIFMVDDGSTDGTSDAVLAQFPDVRIIRGMGGLFWNGGMRVAFAEAIASDFDAFLLLNDDTMLDPDAIERLATEMAPLGPDYGAIVVGAVADPCSNVVNYGGWVRTSRTVPAKLALLGYSPHRQTCDTFNANCVLVGRRVASELGNLDPGFTHGMGDFDYGLRAGAADIPIVVLPGTVGECPTNTGTGLWVDKSLPLRRRWALLSGPKGLPPREWLRYCIRHGGPVWPALWLKPYLEFWFDGVVRRDKKRNGE
jgi:GT2 family glycosyltransferase